jgi:hypothetical protein
MTESVQLLGRRPALGSRTRLLACYGAIVACLPYLALKIAWLAGSDIGTIGDGAADMADTEHVVGNVATIGLELAFGVVMLALTYPWGQRLPAWLVLLPMWVGTGLLAPIAVGVPLGVVVQAIAGGAAAAPDNGLQGWVYGVVYGGFTVQAVLLVTAFVLYARKRWPELLHFKSVARPSLLTTAAAVFAAGFGVMNVVWAGTGGEFGGYPAAVQTVAQKTFWVGQGLLGIAGAIGVLALVHRRGPAVLPLCAAWVGTGVTFASGLYAAGVEAGSSPIRLFFLLLDVIAGLVMAATIAAAVRGRRDG